MSLLRLIVGAHLNIVILVLNLVGHVFKDFRLDLRSWLPVIDQLRGWTEH